MNNPMKNPHEKNTMKNLHEKNALKIFMKNFMKIFIYYF